jgi:hypothetical protein
MRPHKERQENVGGKNRLLWLCRCLRGRNCCRRVNPVPDLKCLHIQLKHEYAATQKDGEFVWNYRRIAPGLVRNPIEK